MRGGAEIGDPLQERRRLGKRGRCRAERKSQVADHAARRQSSAAVGRQHAAGGIKHHVRIKGDRPEGQLTAAAGIRRGLANPSGSGRHWSSPAAEVTAFDAKADALAVLAAAGLAAAALQVAPGGPVWFHPGRSGTIQIGPQNILGHFGELNPRVLQTLGAEGPVVAFEVILDKIPEPKARATRARPVLGLSPFQPVERDFAFTVERAVKAADILRAAQNVDRKLISGVSVFDVYEGKGIEPGKKSIAIAVTIQPCEKTLTDQEIEALSGKVQGNGRPGGIKITRPAQGLPSGGELEYMDEMTLTHAFDGRREFDRN